MGKKLKDPNKPKKPLTAYFRYLADVRESVKAENPGIKPAPLTKICGKMWSTLDPEKKKVYQEAATKDNNEWKVKMAAYKMTPEFAAFQEKSRAHNAEQKKKDKKRKRKTPKDTNAPKKPPTAFFLYSASVREEVKQGMPEDQRKKVTIITKKIGEMWKTISAEEKASWTTKSHTLRAEYNAKFEEYKKSPQYAAYQQLLADHRNKIAEEEERERARNKKLMAKQRQVRQKQMAAAMGSRVLDSESSDDERGMPMEDTEEESSESEES